MSPEQAAGHTCDARTDAWAWGVILFEMLTGTRLFGEDSPSETLAAVIRAEPDWDALPAQTPSTVRRVLVGCLRKKPHDRWHAIADVRLMLDGGDDAECGPVATPSRWRPSPAWVLIAVLGLAIGWLLTRGTAIETTEVDDAIVRSAIALPQDTQLAGWASPAVALSPDGRRIAFVAMIDDHKRLFLRDLGSETALEVPDSDGAEGPFFSRDGRWLGFGAGSISGASPDPRRLKKYDVETGTAERFDLEPDFISDIDVSPDGSRLAVCIGNRELWIHDLRRGTRLRLPPGEMITKRRPLWTPTGDAIVFTGFGLDTTGSLNLCLQPGDGVRTPVRLESQVGEFFAGSWVPGTSTLLFHGFETDQAADIATRFQSIDVDAPGTIETLDLEDRRIGNPTLSPDGRWLAYVSGKRAGGRSSCAATPTCSGRSPSDPARACAGRRAATA